MVEYNMATEEDHEEIYQLLRTVFNRPEEFLNRHRLAMGDPYYKPEQRHIVRVDGKIMGHVYTPHRVTRIGVARVDIGGIMWVGTDPGQWRKGYGRQLMKEVIDYLKNQGCVASPLTATLFDFYRPLGYEAYHDEVRTKISTLSLPKENDIGFSVKEYTPSDLPGLMSIYDEFYRTWTCTICRPQEYWNSYGADYNGAEHQSRRRGLSFAIQDVGNFSVGMFIKQTVDAVYESFACFVQLPYQHRCR